MESAVSFTWEGSFHLISLCTSEVRVGEGNPDQFRTNLVLIRKGESCQFH
jgi:hypothetical protein